MSDLIRIQLSDDIIQSKNKLEIWFTYLYVLCYTKMPKLIDLLYKYCPEHYLIQQYLKEEKVKIESKRNFEKELYLKLKKKYEN